MFVMWVYDMFFRDNTTTTIIRRFITLGLHYAWSLLPPSTQEGPPGPELSVGGLAVSLSGADHLQGGLEAVPQVPVRDQVIAVLLDIA